MWALWAYLGPKLCSWDASGSPSSGRHSLGKICRLDCNDATPIATPGIARVGKTSFNFFFPGFWPHLGPGRRPLDSDRRDAEFAGVFASVAFLTVSFVPKSIFWNPAEKK